MTLLNAALAFIFFCNLAFMVGDSLMQRTVEPVFGAAFGIVRR